MIGLSLIAGNFPLMRNLGVVKRALGKVTEGETLISEANLKEQQGGLMIFDAKFISYNIVVHQNDDFSMEKLISEANRTEHRGG